jgi:serine/threonine-protein kinase
MTGPIGSYEVVDLIGEGGMGAVYRGRDPRFDRPVAIKVLHPQFQRDPGVVERFKAEAVIQAKLNHPHIVTVLDFVAEPGALAIVMEFVDGLPLGNIVEAKGALAIDRTVRLVDQVLSAMGYAHKRGLVHRDIKPSNILVQSIEGEEYAKVMDFGIAKILGSEKLRTATGAKMGTLAYMSPEHVRSPKHVDARSDIYSLGVVLFELLTGCVPFDAETEYELMRRIVQEAPPDPRSLTASLPEALTAVVARALAKDPAERYHSCEEMRRALALVRSGGERVPAPAPAPARALAPSAAPAPLPVPAPATHGATAAALYEEWVILRRREIDEEVKRATSGCQAVGCLALVGTVAGTFLLSGALKLREDGVVAAFVAIALLAGLVVGKTRQGRDQRVAKMVDRYEAMATEKRRALGIPEDFMRERPGSGPGAPK